MLKAQQVSDTGLTLIELAQVVCKEDIFAHECFSLYTLILFSIHHLPWHCKATTTVLNPSDLPVVNSCADKGYTGVRTKSMLQRPP
jgi:hypothetical protein